MAARIARRVGSLAVLSLLAAACETGAGGAATTDGGAAPPTVLRPRSNPIEFVGLTVERPVTEESFLALVGPIFGEAAQRGERHRDHELQPGLLLTVRDDPRTPEQAAVSLDMVTSGTTSPERRTVLRVPVSFTYGRVFVDAVRAALAEANAKFARDPDGARPFELEYRVTSVQGGALAIRVNWDAGNATLTLQTENPRTSLRPGEVNRAAFEGEPYEVIAGTVHFSLNRDEFAFFTDRAYGVTAGAAQNFRDFQLVPHNWLRLTVTPRFADRLVDVGFEVVTVDGRRVPFARAPASVVAGEQFRQNVFRLVDNMNAQEARQPGSSTPFTVPFHYDDPEGGGVVRVIAHGRRGRFTIAYSVESPARRLRDVEFVPYTGRVEVPTTPPAPRAVRCEDHGSTAAVRGRFRVKFDASATVRASMNLRGPLRGHVWGSVYRAADVTITGPRPGAAPVASFHYENVDITDRAALREYELPTELTAGDYQILGFMDVNANADPMDADPDTYDPVTLPIGAYALACAVQPVVVEFALLLPPGQ